MPLLFRNLCRSTIVADAYTFPPASFFVSARCDMVLAKHQPKERGKLPIIISEARHLQIWSRSNQWLRFAYTDLNSSSELGIAFRTCVIICSLWGRSTGKALARQGKSQRGKAPWKISFWDVCSREACSGSKLPPMADEVTRSACKDQPL